MFKFGCFLLSFWGAMHAAWALDFQSVAQQTIAYDRPNEDASKRYIVRVYTPVEALTESGAFKKVRDFEGDIFWLKTAHLSKTRTVVVTKSGSFLYSQPGGAAHQVMAVVEKNVAFFYVNHANRLWVKVRDINGVEGFMHITDLWGV